MIVLPSFHYSKAVCANRKNVIKITRGSSVYLFAAHDLQVCLRGIPQPLISSYARNAEFFVKKIIDGFKNNKNSKLCSLKI